jgi:beta-lactamase class A
MISCFLTNKFRILDGTMLLVRLFLICVIAVGTYMTLDVAYAASLDTKIAVSPIPDPIQGVQQATDSAVPTTAPVEFGQDMGKAVEDALAGSKGTYAVVIKDLQTGTTYTRNENHVFGTASLYKLWVMGETYKQIADGKFTEETRVNNSVAGLNKAFGISSDSAELKEGSFDMSVKEALEKMITVSHNYAAYLLTLKIKSSNMRSFVETNGFSKSKIGPDPESTASDMAMFLEKLYKGELGNQENTQKMKTLLAGQKLNDRIPKYLPKGVTVMHKTGELGGVKHDVGIVSGPKGDYIIVLMSDSSNPKIAAERMANISKNVYSILGK